MQTYLHITCMDLDILIDSMLIREILEIDQSERTDCTEANGWRNWRGTPIPSIDLRVISGKTELPEPCNALIYMENGAEQPIMFLCDTLCGLIHTTEAAFCALPLSSGRIADFVDALLPDSSSNRILFRLKQGVFDKSWPSC